jgi:hypothetical protein
MIETRLILINLYPTLTKIFKLSTTLLVSQLGIYIIHDMLYISLDDYLSQTNPITISFTNEPILPRLYRIQSYTNILGI